MFYFCSLCATVGEHQENKWRLDALVGCWFTDPLRRFRLSEPARFFRLSVDRPQLPQRTAGMARYLGPKVKLSRRVGVPIADIPKHTAKRQLTPPGPHGFRGRRHEGLRRPSQREAEAPSSLPRAGEAVPSLRRRGGSPQGQHRRHPAPASRAASRQRRPPGRLRAHDLGRAPDGDRTATCW